jgi:hypothetical protein
LVGLGSCFYAPTVSPFESRAMTTNFEKTASLKNIDKINSIEKEII